MSNKERLDIRFSNSSYRARHLLSLPRCTGFKIINENVLMVLLRPTRICLNNPIQLGATCLDISKTIFYGSYYNKLKPMFDDDIEYVSGDTDSLICTIRDPEKTVLQKHVQFADYFDFSKISNRKFFELFPDIPDLKMCNAGKLGLLKIETISARRGYFVKPKVYCLQDGDGEEEKRAKSVNKEAMEDIHGKTYEEVVKRDELVYIDANMIRSYDHNLFNIKVHKLGFHSLSVSRAFVSFNESYPYGHYHLAKNCK